MCKLDCIKIRNFYSLKDIVKRKPQTDRKYLQITYLINELYLEYIKNPQNSIIREQNPLKDKQNI